MKKIALAIMAIVTGFSLMAQTADPTSPKHKKFRKMETRGGGQDFEKLNLTDNQRAQIKTSNESLDNK